MWRTFWIDISSTFATSISKAQDEFLTKVEAEGYEPKFINLALMDGYNSTYRFHVTARKKDA